MKHILIIFSAVFVATAGIAYTLHMRNVNLQQRMEEAAREIRIHELEKQLSDTILVQQQEKEHARNINRADIEKQLEAGACLRGDAHIDYLLGLLDKDYEKRCGKTASVAAH